MPQLGAKDTSKELSGPASASLQTVLKSRGLVKTSNATFLLPTVLHAFLNRQDPAKKKNPEADQASDCWHRSCWGIGKQSGHQLVQPFLTHAQNRKFTAQRLMALFQRKTQLEFSAGLNVLQI